MGGWHYASTLERWHSETLVQLPGKKVWTATARFDAVLVTATTDEAGKAAWCRANGVCLKSDDNAYVESLFRTAKYRPEFLTKGFADLDVARSWAAGFVHWYNVEHRHSGIRYVSPAQRHVGRMWPSLQHVDRYSNRLGDATQHADQVTRATVCPSRPPCSTRSASQSSRPTFEVKIWLK